MIETHNTSSRFYTTPCELWDAVFEDCSQARTSIICEHYIMENDVVGQRFLDLFISKAQSGIEIILILDGVGSRKLITSPQITALRDAGGIVHFYNSPTLWLFLRPWRWFPRNHNKIMLIDGKIGYLGSACFQLEMCNWRDLTIRFTGVLVHDLYHKIKSKDIYRSRLFRDRKKILPPINKTDTPDAIDLSFSISQPYLGYNPIYRTLLQHINQARDHILLVTPYFLPPYRLRKALIKASRRGVTVTLMLSRKTDVPTADCVSRSYLPYLLRNGIKVIMYQETILHAKYVIIDSVYAMVGSTNLDYLSLLHNHETNMMIYDNDMIMRLTQQFEQDAKACQIADWNYWHRLPRFYRWLGRAGRFARKVM